MTVPTHDREDTPQSPPSNHEQTERRSTLTIKPNTTESTSSALVCHIRRATTSPLNERAVISFIKKCCITLSCQIKMLSLH